MYVLFGFVALLRLAVLVSGQNMLRFACSQLLVDRSDPLVFPGRSFTPHLHQIVGGNSFNLTMDPKGHDLAGKSTCTSCSFTQDFSNYWTAVMFFHHKNGSVIRVPQVGNGGPQGKLINNGGFDIYYIPSGKTTAFAPGFRMIVGSATNTDPNKVSKSNICHRCWPSTNEGNFVGGAPCTGTDTVEIPKDPKCKMIRQTLIFPTCWDGKNLDSTDHQSHVAYGQGSGANGGGACPSSHSVKLPQIMYELMWDVSAFADQSMWPTDGSPPFTYSMGIGGAAAHGDYIFGWKGDSLQKAMDNGCNLNNDCPKAGLTAQTPAQYNACTLRQYSPEPVNGWLQALPMGDMPSDPGAPQPVPSNTPVYTPPPVTTPDQPVYTPPPPTPANPSAPQQTHYGQCGGQGYTGPTVCQSPYTCKAQNQWYSQCT